MRYLTVTVAVALALLIGAGVYCTLYSKRVSDDYKALAAQVERDARLEAWPSAQEKALRLAAAWRETGDVLSMWVNHADVDDVTIALSRLQIALEMRDAAESLSIIAELNENLSHIYHRDSLSLKIVF